MICSDKNQVKLFTGRMFVCDRTIRQLSSERRKHFLFIRGPKMKDVDKKIRGAAFATFELNYKARKFHIIVHIHTWCETGI